MSWVSKLLGRRVTPSAAAASRLSRSGPEANQRIMFAIRQTVARAEAHGRGGHPEVVALKRELKVREALEDSDG